MFKRIVAGQIRHLFGGAGAGAYGWMVANGVSPTDVEAIIAGAVALAMAAWSMYEKVKSDKKMEKMKDEKTSTNVNS